MAEESRIIGLKNQKQRKNLGFSDQKCENGGRISDSWTKKAKMLEESRILGTQL